jgi:tetratricopeptide (TPR) repeat protein/tRNA A-37 threonylcarbamoyl transferase component Bud32/TolB-like protein
VLAGIGRRRALTEAERQQGVEALLSHAQHAQSLLTPPAGSVTVEDEPEARWDRIRKIVPKLHQLDAAERATLAGDACADDPALRAQVEQLVDNYTTALEFFGRFPDLLPVVADRPTPRRAFSDGEIVFERFRIVRLLGEGGMGEVYEAADLVLHDERIALKTLRANLAADESAIERLTKELQLARRITHPNVCRVHDVYQHRSSSGARVLFFTMELLNGSTLAHRLRRGTMPKSQVLPIVTQMAAALDAAHLANVAHGDFKPGNIMLVPSDTGPERVVVTDFGLARWLPVGSALLSTSGDNGRWGTPAYMAPEQLFGGKITRSTDIYALGVVLYEMVTGNQPFTPDSPLVLALRKLRDPPRPPQVYVTDLDSRWQKVILRCLDGEPKKRFKSATEVVRALEGGQRISRWWIPAVAALACACIFVIPPVREKVVSTSATVAAYFTGQRTVALLPFTNENSASENRAFSVGLAAAVTDQLRTLSHDDRRFYVAPAAEVLITGVDTPALVHQTLGASLIVAGRLTQQNDRTVITVTLNDTSRDDSTGSPSQTMQVEPGERGLLATRVATLVAQMIGIRLSRAAERRLATGTDLPVAETSYLLGRGYLLQGPLKLTSAIGAFDEAIRQDERYAAAYAGLSEAQLKRYQATKDPGFITSALANANAANTFDPADARSHVIRGEVYRASAQYQRAIQEFHAALELDADIPDARTNLADVHDANGEIELAEKAYRGEISRHPTYWSGYEKLGGFLYRRGRYDEAEQNFVTGSRYAPANARAVGNLAGLYEFRERFGAAEAELRNGLRLAPDAVMYNNLGWVFILQKKFEEAVDTLKLAVKLPSADSVIWSSLARACRWAGTHKDDEQVAYTKALELANDHLRVNPMDKDILSNRAYLLAEMGHREEARREIGALLTTDGARGDMTILFRSALIYEQVGDRKAALAALEAAATGGYSISRIARDPDFTQLVKDPSYQRVVDNANRSVNRRLEQRRSP